MEEWERGREWKKGEGMGMWEEWAKAGIDKGADNKIKQTPHSRESGNLPVAGAGRATHGLHLIPCGRCPHQGSGDSRFRGNGKEDGNGDMGGEWEKGAGMRMRGEWAKAGIEKGRTTKLNKLPIPAKAGISLGLRRSGLRARRFALSFAPMARE